MRCYAARQPLHTATDGSWIPIARMVLVRQMPGSAKDVMFIKLEDESANANLIVGQPYSKEPAPDPSRLNAARLQPILLATFSTIPGQF